VLEEIGMDSERIELWRTKESAEVSWTAFWEISRRKLASMAAEEEGGRDDSGGEEAARRD
jgi:hypothetical protein